MDHFMWLNAQRAIEGVRGVERGEMITKKQSEKEGDEERVGMPRGAIEKERDTFTQARLTGCMCSFAETT